MSRDESTREPTEADLIDRARDRADRVLAMCAMMAAQQPPPPRAVVSPPKGRPVQRA